MLRHWSWFVVFALIITLFRSWADEKNDEYLRIYSLVQEGDTLDSKGKPAAALAKYSEAVNALRKFKQNYPEWNTKSVSFRLNYLNSKIADLSQKTSNPAVGNQVKLLEAGAEPRKVLRLHPRPADKQILSMTLNTAMGMKMGQMENPPMKMPAMKIKLGITIKDVSADGDITYESTISDATVASGPDAIPQLTESVKAALDAAKGLTGTGVLSSRGISKASELKVPPDADAQTRQAMEQIKETFSNLATPLPEEAIGPGGKWEARTQIKSQGMTIDQTATYELVSIDGERLVLKSSTVQSAANQKIENPAMPGVKMDLTKMDGKGAGELKFDLAQLLPREGTLSSHADFAMAMNMGSQTQAMATKIDTTMALESK